MVSIFNTCEQHLEVGESSCYAYLATTGKLSRGEDMIVVVWRQYCWGMLGARRASIPILLSLVPKTLTVGEMRGIGVGLE